MIHEPTPASRKSQEHAGANSRRESDAAQQKRLSRAAPLFDRHAFVHHRCRDELLSRLDLLRIDPAMIVDIGAHTGSASAALAQRYPRATVFAVERNRQLLAKRRWRRRFALRQPRVTAVRAAMARMPFADNSIDLAFCNLSLARQAEPDTVLREISRILKPGGAFVFSTAGPDTLKELRQAWAGDDSADHVASFTDMHDIGDALGRAGFAEPVLDVEQFRAEYQNTEDLWRDLTASAARNCLAGRWPALTGTQRFRSMAGSLGTPRGTIDVSVEIVYGQCWGGAARPPGGDIRIAASDIGRRG